MAKKPVAAEPLQDNPPQHITGEPSLAQLQQQLDTAVSEIANLQQQMLESSALIQALAEQNAQLIKRVETHRVRLLAMGAALMVLIVAAIVTAIVLAS